MTINDQESFTDRYVKLPYVSEVDIDVNLDQGGDAYLVVEIGEQTVDVTVTSRARLLAQKVAALEIPRLVTKSYVGCECFSPILRQECC